jgi:hypothetical protein
MAINVDATRARGAGQIKFAAINVSTATTTALIAAPGLTSRIAIMGIRFHVAGAAQTCTFKSDTTTLWGPFEPGAGGQVQWSDGNFGIGSCDTNKALNLVTDDASQVSGVVTYVIETVF